MIRGQVGNPWLVVCGLCLELTLMEVHDTVPAGDGGPYAAALPRLVQETELQKSLADEKMRSEQHKTHYQILKAEHAR